MIIATIHLNETLTNTSVIQEFCKLVSEKRINILAIQGITPSFYIDLVRELKNLGYNHFPPSKKVTEDIFVLGNINNTDKKPFYNSYQNKHISICEFTYEGDKIIGIASSVLEEEASFVVRRKQINEIDKFLSSYSYALFLGDMCITSFEETALPNNWLDAWFECGSAENKYTYDGKRNPNVNSNIRDRRERILCKGFDIEYVDLLLDKNDPPLSNHYGVIAQVNLI
jgi:hypothetical protein